MSKKTLLFTIAALSLIAFALEYFYSENSFKKKFGNWYDQGRKAVGL